MRRPAGICSAPRDQLHGDDAPHQRPLADTRALGAHHQVGQSAGPVEHPGVHRGRVQARAQLRQRPSTRGVHPLGRAGTAGRAPVGQSHPQVAHLPGVVGCEPVQVPGPPRLGRAAALGDDRGQPRLLRRDHVALQDNSRLAPPRPGPPRCPPTRPRSSRRPGARTRTDRPKPPRLAEPPGWTHPEARPTAPLPRSAASSRPPRPPPTEGLGAAWRSARPCTAS